MRSLPRWRRLRLPGCASAFRAACCSTTRKVRSRQRSTDAFARSNWPAHGSRTCRSTICLQTCARRPNGARSRRWKGPKSMLTGWRRAHRCRSTRMSAGLCRAHSPFPRRSISGQSAAAQRWLPPWTSGWRSVDVLALPTTPIIAPIDRRHGRRRSAARQGRRASAAQHAGRQPVRPLRDLAADAGHGATGRADAGGAQWP